MADWWSGNEGWQDVWGGAGGIAQTRKRAGTALKKLSNTRRYQVTKSTPSMSVRRLSTQTGGQRRLGREMGQYLSQSLAGPERPITGYETGRDYQAAARAGTPLGSAPMVRTPIYGQAQRPAPTGAGGALRSYLQGDVPQGVLQRGEGYYNAMAAPLERQFEEVTLPRVREAWAGGGGYWGGGRAMAEQRAGEGFNEQMMAMRARTMMGLEQSSSQAMLGAIGMAPNMSMYENPQYGQQMAAVQAGLGLTGQNWMENIVQPQQNVSSYYTNRRPQGRTYPNMPGFSAGQVAGNAYRPWQLG